MDSDLNPRVNYANLCSDFNREAPGLKLDLHGPLIDFFQKPVSEDIVDLKSGPDDFASDVPVMSW
ncbi:MAG TPA: hypothetical protein VMV10_27525 [Pirellulales bacterium]|nr:hypothetical protein [Pirellulales bacterium]